MKRFLTKEDLQNMEFEALTEEEMEVVIRCMEHLKNGELLTIDDYKIQLVLREGKEN